MHTGVTVCQHCSRPLPMNHNDPALTATLTSIAETPGSGGELEAGTIRPDLICDGEQMGHFLIQQLLGHGGMGAVYRALDTSLQRYVAVKVLRRGRSDRSSGSAASESPRSDASTIADAGLRAEAISQARLNHQNIVTVYYVGREDQGEEAFFAMELLPGPTLDECAPESFAYGDVVDIGVQVTKALQHAQKMHVHHGDIKPSNLIYAGDQIVKLGDFGLARRLDVRDDDKPMAGTPNYLAPEIVDGGAINEFSDMYALGITLFELTFRRRPYELSGDTLLQQLKTHAVAVVDYPKPWPRGVPQSWRMVLDRLMAKDPAQRYEDYASLLQDLRDSLPSSSMAAGRMARFVALTIDYLLMGTLCTLMLIPASILQQMLQNGRSENFADLPPGMLESAFILASACLVAVPIIPLLLLFAQARGHKTLGRKMMQLRVVDQRGFDPPQSTTVPRSILRMLPIWVSVVLAIPTTLGIEWIGIFNAVASLWIFINCVSILFPGRSTLIDRIMGTRVVLSD